MSSVALLMLICVCSKLLIAGCDITKYGFNQQMQASLKILCPGVDICSGSGSSLKSNEILDESGTTSCCHRCSCQEDCHASLTCCFPENNVTINDKQEVSSKKLSGTRGLTIANRRGPPQPIFGFTDKEEPVSQEKNILTSLKNCVYSQTGSPDGTWPTTVPAYLMITEQPHGGCKASPNIYQENEDKMVSCDSSALFPWGTLYPVYSRERNTIYKNEECARCHGEFDTSPWTAILVCDNYDQQSDREVSLSEHFDFLNQDGGLSDTCFVSFYYPNSTVKLDNRCFVDTVKSCSLDVNHEFFVIPNEVNLTKSEVVSACETGLKSPVSFRNGVYQNVFCAICNRPLILQQLFCSIDIDPAKNFGAFKLTYLLDTYQLYRTIAKNHKGKTTLDHIACLRKGSTWDEDSCRRLLCPAGQTRNSEGECVFVCKRWFGSVFSLVIKLKPDVNTRGISAILDTFEIGNINSETRLGSFKKTTPWPSYWKIVRILRSTETNKSNDEPLVAIELQTDITRPEVLTTDIPKSLSKPWNLIAEDKTFLFRQSKLEYSIRYGDRPLTPWWRSYIDPAMSLNITYTEWNMLYFDVHAQIPYPISKLWTCQRVTLMNDEYILLADRYLLMTNITKRQIMFDQEFELAVTGNGQQMIHVCLEDTRLVQKGQSSGSLRLAKSYPTRVMVFIYTLLYFLKRIIFFSVYNHTD